MKKTCEEIAQRRAKHNSGPFINATPTQIIPASGVVAVYYSQSPVKKLTRKMVICWALVKEVGLKKDGWREDHENTSVRGMVKLENDGELILADEIDEFLGYEENGEIMYSLEDEVAA